jgi:uncharacterized protein (TIRG00374 family)
MQLIIISYFLFIFAIHITNINKIYQSTIKLQKKLLNKIIKIVFVVGIIVFTVFQLTKELNVTEFSNILLSIRWEYCLLSLIPAILSHWIRAMRWKIFLEPVHSAKSTINLFSAVMVGYLVNNITPRGGELVRPFVYARREKISKTAVFATIVVERVIDVIFLLLMFAVAFFASRSLISSAFPWLTTSMLTYLIIVVCVIIIALFLLITTNLFDLFLMKIAKSLAPKKYERINEIWNSFKKGFETLKNPKRYLRIFIESAIIWILYALPLYIMFFAFDFQNTLNLGVFDAGLLIVVSGIGSTIAPTPGVIGVYHWLIVTALTHLYPSITREESLAFATVTHGINLLLQVALGCVFILRENIRKIPTKKEFEIETNIQ